MGATIKPENNLVYFILGVNVSQPIDAYPGKLK